MKKHVFIDFNANCSCLPNITCEYFLSNKKKQTSSHLAFYFMHSYIEYEWMCVFVRLTLIKIYTNYLSIWLVFRMNLAPLFYHLLYIHPSFTNVQQFIKQFQSCFSFLYLFVCVCVWFVSAVGFILFIPHVICVSNTNWNHFTFIRFVLHFICKIRNVSLLYEFLGTKRELMGWDDENANCADTIIPI